MTRDVTEVRPLDGYRLLLTFEGGDNHEVDVSSQATIDGVFEPLRDKTYFRQVRVEPEIGTIVWPNGADLCPDVLFESCTTTSNKVA